MTSAATGTLLIDVNDPELSLPWLRNESEALVQSKTQSQARAEEQPAGAQAQTPAQVQPVSPSTTTSTSTSVAAPPSDSEESHLLQQDHKSPTRMYGAVEQNGTKAKRNHQLTRDEG